jgi:hypothetical protein
MPAAAIAPNHLLKICSDMLVKLFMLAC